MTGKMPEYLSPGDLIRIISPSGPVDPEMLRLGAKILEEWEYVVEISPNALKGDGYLAGNDDERLADLMDALTDKQVKGIICSRGGYGVMRILRIIDWQRIENTSPKVFVGFSDIGALQAALLNRCGWITYSGPQAAMGLGGDMSPRSLMHLRRMIDGSNFQLSWSDIEKTVLRTGETDNQEITGVLIPICLSILVSLIGTPYMPDLKNTLLCIEDVNEPLYRIDRMIWQLHASGNLEQVNALVLGAFTWQDNRLDDSVEILCKHYCKKNSIPLFSGLPYGHIDDKITLPFGARASIDANGEIRLEEVH